MPGRRYNSFAAFVQGRFGGQKLQKVNIDAGFTCPNRDGTVGVGGCIYCNNDSFRPASCKPTLSITRQVENGTSYLSKRYGADLFLPYFQPYSNTYADVETLRRYYAEALRDTRAAGLAIGTRPDCVDEEKIALLEEIARTRFVLVEYGLQSIYDKTLRYINRGHDYECFLRAIELTRGRGIHIGAHVIVGFPTETREETLAMADELSSLDIGFLKIHQLQVVKGTALARIYEHESFRVFDYDEYLDFTVDFIERLRPDIVLQRLFATAPDDILIAPRWARDRHRILRDIERRFIERDTRQGALIHKPH